MQLAEESARTHHERWDGSGYLRLQGETIPIVGRIVAVADVFDALISERPYKKAWSRFDAIEEIQRQSGHQFDPRVVDAFLKIIALNHEDTSRTDYKLVNIWKKDNNTDPIE